MFLECGLEQGDTPWSCLASADLRILHTRGGDKFSGNITHIFSNKERRRYISWADGHIITNDSVTFEVKISAEAPLGVCWDSKKQPSLKRQLDTERIKSNKLWKRPRVLIDENSKFHRTSKAQELKVKIQQKESENVILKNKLEQKNKEVQLQKEIFEIEKEEIEADLEDIEARFESEKKAMELMKKELKARVEADRKKIELIIKTIREQKEKIQTC